METLQGPPWRLELVTRFLTKKLMTNDTTVAIKWLDHIDRVAKLKIRVKVGVANPISATDA